MTELEFRDAPTVDLLDCFGNDDKVAEMARGSIGKMRSTPEANERLIRSLMRDGHKVPFEHCAMTFRIECPIFVSRQLVKHRHSSISEISGRYSELAPVFYIPSMDRPMGQEGSRMAYDMVHLDEDMELAVQEVMQTNSQSAWDDYEYLLERGVSRELSRAVLPTNIFTEIRMTVNLLSLMNILQLRIDWGSDAAKPSHPQYEIEQVATYMYWHFNNAFPVVSKAFAENGYAV